jgi:hypothetical protein
LFHLSVAAAGGKVADSPGLFAAGGPDNLANATAAPVTVGGPRFAAP